MTSVQYVREKDIVHYTDGIASVVDPEKGKLLFATKAFTKGSVIAHLRMIDIKAVALSNIDDFKMYLNNQTMEEAKRCIEHSVPTGNGQILVPKVDHWNNFFNSSSTPNVFSDCEYYTKQQWKLIACKNIEIGDELTQDYNQTVGYEVRNDEKIMRDFLNLCEQYNVEKRPSKLTLPPRKVKIVLESKL